MLTRCNVLHFHWICGADTKIFAGVWRILEFPRGHGLWFLIELFFILPTYPSLFLSFQPPLSSPILSVALDFINQSGRSSWTFSSRVNALPWNVWVHAASHPVHLIYSKSRLKLLPRDWLGCTLWSFAVCHCIFVITGSSFHGDGVWNVPFVYAVIQKRSRRLIMSHKVRLVGSPANFILNPGYRIYQVCWLNFVQLS